MLLPGSRTRSRIPLTRTFALAWRGHVLAWLAACLLAFAPALSQLHAARSPDLLPEQTLCSTASVRSSVATTPNQQRALILLTGACPLCVLQSPLPPWPVVLPQLAMRAVVDALVLPVTTEPVRVPGLPPATGPPATFRSQSPR
jgi:hypothetical protein